MIVRTFVDTNILVYAASTRPEETAKKKRANELILLPDWGTSAQILAEFYSVVTRKGQPPMPASIALQWVEQFEKLPCLPVDAGLVKHGIVLSQINQISYWDGAILAAAEAMGAATLYSEDLNHGQTYGAVRVINPFVPPP